MKTIRNIQVRTFGNSRQLIVAQIRRGGLPALQVEMVVAYGQIEGTRFIDVSGGEYSPCGCWMSADRRDSLAREILAAA